MGTRDVRQRALQKIAALSATSSAATFDRSDLDRLCKATRGHARAKEASGGAGRGQSLSRVPMVNTPKTRYPLRQPLTSLII